MTVSTPSTQNFFAAIIETSEDAIVSMDTAGAILTWNTSAELLFGYEQAEILGRNIKTLIPTEAEEEQRQITLEVQAGQRIRRYESVRINKLGQYIDVSIAISPIHAHTGEIIGSSMIAQDITAQKIIETQLQAYLQELERSNDDLQGFAHITAHDLKEPLRGLRGMSSILLEDYQGRLDTDGVKLLNWLVTLCGHMDALINNLLYFSKLGNETSAIRTVDLNAVVRDIQEMMAFTLHEKNGGIIVPHPLPHITCNQVRITEVFRNLLTNAFKYNDNPKPTAEIGYLESMLTPHGREENVFYIKDNGIGIEPRYHQSIFSMFKKAPSSSQDSTGAGVGLAFVKKIIERHGGHIWLSSQPGEGSTFYFSLPSKGIELEEKGEDTQMLHKHPQSH